VAALATNGSAHRRDLANDIERAAARLARALTRARREEEARARKITARLHAANEWTAPPPSNGLIDDGERGGRAGHPGQRNGADRPRAGASGGHRDGLLAWRRAMLIINSKSGPNHDSVLRVRELVDLLAGHGIDAEVRVKLHKSTARKDARAAAKSGCKLVIAAGGDGTVAAVARGLMGTGAALGIIPLGTFNNVATSLGIPPDPVEACGLIAAGPIRRIDVGEVEGVGRKKPRAFLEMAAVGLAGALMPVGQHVEKGRWEAAGRALPAALHMTPTAMTLRLDGESEPRPVESLLVEVANAPRVGAGLVAAPEARMDDGLLDVTVYAETTQSELAARFVALKAGLTPEGPHVQRLRAQTLVVQTATQLPVVADSKTIGTTPARFRVQPGALAVIAGHGSGLERPPAEALVDASTQLAHHVAAQTELAEEAEAEETTALLVGAAAVPTTALTRSVQALSTLAGGASRAVERLRPYAVPAAAAGGALAVPLLRRLARRPR
jgi:diacylglycerol kinase (ATP)